MTADRSWRASWGADAASLGLLALAVAAFFPQVVFDGGVFFVQDVMVQNVPFRHFLHEALAEGRLPLWEPRINCGFPLFAEGQVGALYPPNWLLGLLPAAQAVTWSIVIHLWLAAAATWCYLRVLGCGRAGALAAGLTYGLGGYLVVRAMSPNFVVAAALVPVLFALIESGLSRGRPLRIGVAGVVIALQLLAGHPQAALYGSVAAVAYGAVRAWQTGRRQAVLAAAVAVPGVALSAVQLLPTLELAELSLRAGAIGYEQFVNMSLPPERLLCLLLPDFFGNSATGSYWGRQAGFYIQLCPYVGVLSLALALVGAREGSSPARGFLVLLAVAGLALSLGHYTGVFRALHEVPFLRQFRIPTRFLLWWAFGAAALAGLGVDRLVGDPRPLRGSWVPVWLGAVTVIVLATTPNARALWSWVPAADEAVNQMLSRYRFDLTADLWRAAAALATASVLCSAWFRRRPHAGVLTAVCVVVVTWSELRHFGADFNGTISAQVYEHTPASASTVRDDASRWTADAGEGVPISGVVRVASLVSERNAPYDWHSGWTHDTSSYEGYPATLRMYTAGLFGLANTLPGWSPLHLRRHWEFAAGHPALLGVANAGYVVSHGPLASPAVVLLHSGAVRVYRHRQALPRAYVVPEVVVEPDPARRISLLRSGSVDPRRAVILDRRPEVPVVAGADGFVPARIERYEATRVEVDLPGRAGYLVLSDTHAPGWRAFADGEEREILLANHVFRGVSVSADDRRVEFRYEPSSLRAGAWISLGAAALFAVALVVGRGWHWPDPPSSRLVPLVPMALQAAVILALYGVARETSLWVSAIDRLRVLAVADG